MTPKLIAVRRLFPWPAQLRLSVNIENLSPTRSPGAQARVKRDVDAESQIDSSVEQNHPPELANTHCAPLLNSGIVAGDIAYRQCVPSRETRRETSNVRRQIEWLPIRGGTGVHARDSSRNRHIPTSSRAALRPLPAVIESYETTRGEPYGCKEIARASRGTSARLRT